MKLVDAQATASLAFDFSEKFDCSKFQDRIEQKFCREEGPRNWPVDEKVLVTTAIAEAMKNEKLRKVFVNLAEGGPIKLYRMKTSVFINEEGFKEVKKDSSAFFDSRKRGVAFQDHLFEEMKNTKAACPRVPPEVLARKIEHIVIHELGHLYADSKRMIDVDCQFLEAAGWKKTGLTVRTPKQQEELDAKARKIKKSKSHEEAEQWLNREAQKDGYPSDYATSDPHEAFAEFFAHLGRNSPESEKIKPSVRNWFDENVFEKQTMGTGKPCPR